MASEQHLCLTNNARVHIAIGFLMQSKLGIGAKFRKTTYDR
jgi:hypothetical protein